MAINTLTTIYDTNETMRILGQQCSCKYVGGGAIGYNDFMAVIEAHRAADAAAMIYLALVLISLC